MSMRIAASCTQPLQVMALPRGARIWRGSDEGMVHSSHNETYQAICLCCTGIFCFVPRFFEINGIKQRNALLTVSESGKYSLTSDSSMTAPSSSLKQWTAVVPSAL
jgi:hypothetical protein